MRAKDAIQHVLLVLFILLSLLVACKSGKKGELPRPAEQVVITFACHEYHENTYRRLADQFEAANPDVRVQLVFLEPASNLSEVVSRADTLTMPYLSPALARQGRVRDLAPFIMADQTFQPEDFYPHTLDSLQWDGGTWGLPFAVNFTLIVYDKEAFDAAGVPYPEPGWTWDDFLTKAQALTSASSVEPTEREGEEVLRWGFVGRPHDLLPFIQGRAGPLVDASVEPPLPLLNQPQVAQALGWFSDLALVHGVMPRPSVEQSGQIDAEATRLVESGRAAMWSASTRNWYAQGLGGALGHYSQVKDLLNLSSATTRPKGFFDGSFACV